MRRLLCLFLLMLLPLHSFAMQGSWLSDGKAFDLEHDIEHTKKISHHHEDDGSVHYDDSDESAQHESDHSYCQQTAALPSALVPSLNLPISSEIVFFTVTDFRENFPDRPQRPPSALG